MGGLHLRSCLNLEVVALIKVQALTYTVPEDGIYIFGLKATSGSQLAWTQIDFYKNNALDQTVVTDVNDNDNFNNLGKTWTDTLKKGDEVRLKVGLGSVSGYLAWWGVRIFAD